MHGAESGVIVIVIVDMNLPADHRVLRIGIVLMTYTMKRGRSSYLKHLGSNFTYSIEIWISMCICMQLV